MLFDLINSLFKAGKEKNSHKKELKKTKNRAQDLKHRRRLCPGWWRLNLTQIGRLLHPLHNTFQGCTRRTITATGIILKAPPAAAFVPSDRIEAKIRALIAGMVSFVAFVLIHAHAEPRVPHESRLPAVTGDVPAVVDDGGEVGVSLE